MKLETIIYNKINKGQLYLTGHSGELAKKADKARANKLASYLRLRKERTALKCRWCDEKQGRKEISGYYYDSPFDKEGEEYFFCSEDCREQMEGSTGYDFAYRLCDSCNRYIVEQCPSNGWHSYFRYEEDWSVCLQCYEENLLTNGVEEEKFKEGKLTGMFLNNNELREKGWEETQDYFVRTESDAKNGPCKKALSLIEAGYKVLVAYKRMSIGGLEGTVTLWFKKKTE